MKSLYVRQRWVFLLLMLVLGVGSVTPTAVVQAALPAQTNLHLHLKYSIPSTLCVGRDISIRITPLVDMDGTRADGTTFSYKDRLLTGVLITAKVGNKESIATISPASQTSRYLERKDLLSISSPRYTSGLGAVTFTLHTKEAGTANLYLRATVPARISAGGESFGYIESIQVVNCKYRVIADYWWEFSGQGFRTWNFGRLDTTITATRDPQYYGGDGSFNFMLSHFDLTCQRRTSHQMPTHITASPNFVTDQLELTFTIGPPSGTVTDTCPNSFLLAHAAFEDPDAPWRGKPISLPLSGGTKGLTLHAPHPGIPNAKVTISVQPILETGGK